VAAAAARTAGAEQLDLMRRLAHATRDAADWRAYEAADEAFHRAIAAATDSRLLMAILGLLSSVRGRSRWQRQHDMAFRAARERDYSRAQGDLHLALVEAISCGDAGAAEAIMREHLTQIQALMAPPQAAI
jgi:DNA-binding FadR family transcriptional regulator